MPLVIPADVTPAELCEAIGNLRARQRTSGLVVERAELQVEIDAILDRMGHGESQANLR